MVLQCLAMEIHQVSSGKPATCLLSSVFRSLSFVIYVVFRISLTVSSIFCQHLLQLRNPGLGAFGITGIDLYQFR